MLLGRVSPAKQPSETFIVAIDFVRELDAGETITIQAVTSKKLADGSDSSGTFLTSPSISGSKILVRVQGGATGDMHRVQMRATTSNANVYEHEIDVPVEEV
jgi:hypothetical protein